ncbi:MAG TPA: MBL fold metallo-hydrolase [Candidatus Deferrimicrobium sp.]|nr:MBL fold metallo-hydrolase [Candidatus Deferrimicrobium sp.]
MLVHEQLRIYLAQLPLPFKLNHINCYIVKGNAGTWIIDSGLNTTTSRQVWMQFLDQNDIRPEDIRGIYLTHYHPDHFGGAGWMQQCSGAPVYISAVDAEAVNRVWQDSNNQSAQKMAKMFNKNGMPEDLTTDVLLEMNWIVPKTKPHPELTLMHPGDTVYLGDFEFSLLSTPGHSDGHICFFNQEHGVLVSGDHLLPKITSNISLWPDSANDPLNNYLESLYSIRKLNCGLVLPAHGAPFTNMVERIDQLLTHHQERLTLMKSVASVGGTGYEICKQVFKQNLSLHEVRFALSETLAHLMFLVNRGEMKVIEEDGQNIFVSLE